MTYPRTTASFRIGAACTLAVMLSLAGTGPRSGNAATVRLSHRAVATYRSAPATALGKLVLSLQDVTSAFGGGFIKQPGTNLDNTVISSRISSKTGRITGYGIGYVRQHPGLVMVNSGVNLFKNAGFASAAVQRVYTVYSSPQNQKDRVHVEHLHGLGDAGLILSYDLGSQKGMHFRELCVMFSQGAYAADVIVVAGGSIDRGKLLSLANTMDSRIKNA